MATPKNMRALGFGLKQGGAVHTYVNNDAIILQIRKSMPTEENILEPSFKVAVSLTVKEALAIASELILAALRQINDPPQPE